MAEQRLNIRITAQDEASLLLKNVASTIRSINKQLLPSSEIKKMRISMEREFSSLKTSLSKTFRDISKTLGKELEVSIAKAIKNGLSKGSLAGSILKNTGKGILGLGGTVVKGTLDGLISGLVSGLVTSTLSLGAKAVVGSAKGIGKIFTSGGLISRLDKGLEEQKAYNATATFQKQEVILKRILSVLKQINRELGRSRGGISLPTPEQVAALVGGPPVTKEPSGGVRKMLSNISKVGESLSYNPKGKKVDLPIDPNNLIGLGSGLQGVSLQSLAFSAGLLGKGLSNAAKAGLQLRSTLLSVFTAPARALGSFLNNLLSLRNLILGGGLIILMRRFYDQVRELPRVQIAIEPLADSFRALRESAADLFIEMVRVFGPTLIEGVKALISVIDTFGKRVMIVLSTIGKTFYNLFNVIKEAWNNNDVVTLIINAMRTGIQVMWDIIKAGTPVLVESVKYLASSMSHAFITSFLGTTKLEMAKNIEAGGFGAWIIKGFAGSWGGMDNEIDLAVEKLKAIRKIESEIEKTTTQLESLSKISKDGIFGSITSSPETQRYIQDLQIQLDNLKALRQQTIEEASAAVSPIDDSSLKAKSKEFSKNFVEIIKMAREEMGRGLSDTTNEAMDKLTYDFIAGIEQLKSPEATQKLSEAGKAVGETTSKGIFVGMRNGLREIRKELADTVKLGESLINGLATGIESGLNSAFESVIDGTFKVGKALKDMASSVLRQFLSIANRQAALGLTSLIGGLFTPSAPTVTNANGNVLRGGFKAFASGGIVTKPTLGLVGEGKMNEAIVPLPDGRSIPVSMNGGGNNFYVTINAIDSQSFQSALAKNGDSIMNIVVSKIATSPKARQALGSR
jgi:hypothetical protein